MHIQNPFEEIAERLSRIEHYLLALKNGENSSSASEPDRWLSLEELCSYLPGNPAKATIYGKVHRREIPHKKNGKRLIFLKSEIDLWLKSFRRKTISEIEDEAESYLSTHKRKGK